MSLLPDSGAGLLPGADGANSHTTDPNALLLDDASDSAAAAAASAEGTGTWPNNPRKRQLDDKKEREKKRAQRNRELARMSNERRKNRIKAMETELEETKKTVSSLEDSIRALEAENNGLKTLLDAKPSAAVNAIKQ